MKEWSSVLDEPQSSFWATGKFFGFYLFPSHSLGCGWAGGILKKGSCYSLSQECWEVTRLPPGWCPKDTTMGCLNQPPTHIFLCQVTAVRRISSSCDRHCLVFIMKAEIKFFFSGARRARSLHLFSEVQCPSLLWHICCCLGVGAKYTFIH